MRVTTKEEYDERYRRRGVRKQRRVRGSDLAQAWVAPSRPRHEERYANIYDCFPLLKVGHTEKTHPIERVNQVSKV